MTDRRTGRDGAAVTWLIQRGRGGGGGLGRDGVSRRAPAQNDRDGTVLEVPVAWDSV